jgi:DNA-binding response OmpR family regulator
MMLTKRILVIENETDIREMLSLRLKKEEFEVLEASEGMIGLKKALEEQPDLVLLDRMLPHMSGLDILQKLRSDLKTAHLPIIIVSTKKEVSDEIVGFEFGADDYITIPFNMPILIARIKALLRRLPMSA